MFHVEERQETSFRYVGFSICCCYRFFFTVDVHYSPLWIEVFSVCNCSTMYIYSLFSQIRKFCFRRKFWEIKGWKELEKSLCHFYTKNANYIWKYIERQRRQPNNNFSKHRLLSSLLQKIFREFHFWQKHSQPLSVSFNPVSTATSHRAFYWHFIHFSPISFIQQIYLFLPKF